eukprot:6189583-Pleurochrysis_carterae.AAC.4
MQHEPKAAPISTLCAYGWRQQTGGGSSSMSICFSISSSSAMDDSVSSASEGRHLRVLLDSSALRKGSGGTDCERWPTGLLLTGEAPDTLGVVAAARSCACEVEMQR